MDIYKRLSSINVKPRDVTDIFEPGVTELFDALHEVPLPKHTGPGCFMQNTFHYNFGFCKLTWASLVNFFLIYNIHDCFAGLWVIKIPMTQSLTGCLDCVLNGSLWSYKCVSVCSKRNAISLSSHWKHRKWILGIPLALLYALSLTRCWTLIHSVW